MTASISHDRRHGHELGFNSHHVTLIYFFRGIGRLFICRWLICILIGPDRARPLLLIGLLSALRRDGGLKA